MNRYIVLSVNDNPEYLYYVPLTVWAWRKIGWEPIVFYHGHNEPIMKLIYDTFEVLHKDMTAEMRFTLYNHKWKQVDSIEGYRSDTVTQVSRLYAACTITEDAYLMTGDIDMIPLSDFWKPDPNKITVWGHDLCNYKNYPICYIGMTRSRWVETMGLTSSDYNALIKRDLDTLPQAKSTDFYKYWETDQDLITQRIKAVNFDKSFVDRGRYPNGIAIGRVDRGDWTLKQHEFTDAHLHRDLYKVFKEPDNALWQKKWGEHLALLQRVWPNENFDWFVKYTQEFAKMV